MAKKSNKTEHVLRLITRNDEVAEDDDFFDIDREFPETDIPATGNKAEIWEENPEDAELKAAELIEQINDDTEKIVNLEKKQPAVVAMRQVAPADPVRRETPAEEDRKDRQGKPVITPRQEAPAGPAKQESPMVKAFREQENLKAVQEQSGLVNLAEVVAKEKVALVMERMRVCTCRTCVNDVLALALNSLPTKYVTTQVGMQHFQRSAYEKQYETDILAALTKACVRVKASPRH